jgi:hypothetical protein
VVNAMQGRAELRRGVSSLGRHALTKISESEMSAAIDRHLEGVRAEDAADRRNGYYRAR